MGHSKENHCLLSKAQQSPTQTKDWGRRTVRGRNTDTQRQGNATLVNKRADKPEATCEINFIFAKEQRA